MLRNCASLQCNNSQSHISKYPTMLPLIKNSLVAWITYLLACGACAKEPEWSLGVYGGPYYDTMPAGFLTGDAHFKDQYLLALTSSKTLWRSASLPLALEIDGMVGLQLGQATVTEVAVAPVLRWSGFPWNHVLQTDVRLGPLGLSYTPYVSPLERDSAGRGSQFLNFLMIETAFSQPGNKHDEVFLRLHHRCTIYDLMNNYGANGEDFFGIGYRRYF
jgi:hypothetical protein